MSNVIKTVLGSLVISLALAVSSAAQPLKVVVEVNGPAVQQAGGYTNEAGTLGANWQREKEKERPKEREKDRKDERREPPRGDKKDDKRKKPE